MVFGIIAGSLAQFLDPDQNRGGFISSLILGVLGSLLGGFLANLAFGVSITGFTFVSLATSLAGALLLLFLGRAFKTQDI